MEQLGMLKFVIEKDERNYEFMMPFGAPYGEAYDACHEMMGKIVELSQEAQKRATREVEIKTDDDVKLEKGEAQAN